MVTFQVNFKEEVNNRFDVLHLCCPVDNPIHGFKMFNFILELHADDEDLTGADLDGGNCTDDLDEGVDEKKADEDVIKICQTKLFHLLFCVIKETFGQRTKSDANRTNFDFLLFQFFELQKKLKNDV